MMKENIVRKLAQTYEALQLVHLTFSIRTGHTIGTVTFL